MQLPLALIKRWLTHLVVVSVLVAASLLGGCDRKPVDTAESVDTTEAEFRALLDGYRQIALLNYGDALHSANALRTAVDRLLAKPGENTLAAARDAWRAARRDYSQTEVFRFGNWFVDEWEGQVNAWPIDEGLLDYVQDGYIASSNNPLGRLNLVRNDEVPFGSRILSADTLGWRQLEFLQSAVDHETNVLLGYHAVEFMLWGQDTHRFKPGAGERPWTDYSSDPEHCTDGPQSAPIEHCQRRRTLLLNMLAHLQYQLRIMEARWQPGFGSYGHRLVNGDIDNGLRRVLFGLVMLSGDEMAGERLSTALLTNAPEEEQDCFSDDTHNSIAGNLQGVHNVYHGHYEARTARFTASFSVAELAQRASPELAEAIKHAFADSQQAAAAIQNAAANDQFFDVLIAPGNTEGAQLLQTMVASLEQLATLQEQLGEQLQLMPLNPAAPRAASTPAQ